MKVRVYIETENSNFSYQMVNYIHDLKSTECKTIFVLKTDFLNKEFMRDNGVSPVYYNAGELLNAIELVASILSKYKMSEVEVHSAVDASSLVLINFLRIFKGMPHLVKPHIYETSIKDHSLRYNSQIENNHGEKIAELSRKLKEALLGSDAFHGDQLELQLSGYAWHHFTNAIYYVQGGSASSFPAKMIAPLSDEEKSYFAQLYNMPESVVNHVRIAFKQNNVFYCSDLLSGDPSLKDAEKDKIIEKIKIISDNKNLNQFIILSHSNNDALSLGNIFNKVHLLPRHFSLAAMRWLGIYPQNIISTLYEDACSIDVSGYKFIFTDCDESGKSFEDALNDISPCFYFEHIYSHDGKLVCFGLVKQKRIFYSSASMGDVIYGLGAINALRDTYPSEYFVFVTNVLYADLIDSCPSMIEHWDINKLTSAQVFEIELGCKYSKLHFFERWEQILAPQHMTDAFINEVISSTCSQNKNAKISLDNIDKAPVDKFISINSLTSGKVVLLHPNIGDPNRTWTIDGWRNLAQCFLDQGWQVVLIGSNKNKYKEKTIMPIDIHGVINAVNEFSITQTIYLMTLCQLLVSCDAGPVALAGYTDIAISALYSIIPSQHRLPYRHGVLGWNAQGINTNCQYGQCGHFIMSQRFHEKTLRMKWKRPNGEMFSKWCPNNKKYSCMKKFSYLIWWEQIVKFIESEDFVMNNVNS